MTEKAKKLYHSAEAFFKSEKGKLLGKTLKYGFQAGIILLLVYQLTLTGWMEVYGSLPLHPLYYVFFLLIYFSLPVTEYFTYKRHLKLGFAESQEIFLKKRVYNKNVLGYSGEFQLFFWLKKKTGSSGDELFRLVRDNNTLSTLASTFLAVTLLGYFMLSGNIELPEINLSGYFVYVPLAVFVMALLIVLLFQFRKHFFAMNKRDSLAIFGMHSARMYLLAVFQVLQWYVVMPDTGLQIWFTLVSMQIILSRIPLLPNKDLIFLAGGLEYARYADVSTAGVAGLLLVSNILDKVLSLLLFAWFSWRERKG